MCMLGIKDEIPAYSARSRTQTWLLGVTVVVQAWNEPYFHTDK
jgi:hypothetical protein